MSTTTQILFNSPALHSLKRDQLVKLCKIHSLKASGKNKDLIERLQLHANTLPPDDPLSIATRSDNLDAKPVADSEDEASSNHSTPAKPISKSRTGEQWEVVMDTITEVDEETLRSNRGSSDRPVGEFGTNTSKGQSCTLPKSVLSHPFCQPLSRRLSERLPILWDLNATSPNPMGLLPRHLVSPARM